MRRAIIVLGKAPVPGAAKTRLVPPLTPDDAAALYRGFLLDTLGLAHHLEWEETTLVHPRGDGDVLASLCEGVNLLEQPENGLGRALAFAFSHHFERGFENIVLIGSDNPTLPMEPICSAAATLQTASDLAIGPTIDGGYYLIGMCNPHPSLFERIDWSTPRVYEQTLQRARELNLRVHPVTQWYDVDEVTDLNRLETDLSTLPSSVAPNTRAALRRTGFRQEPALEALVPSARHTLR